MKGHEVYCLVDPLFYDSPTLYARPDSSMFEMAAAPVPAGWKRNELDDWLVYIPEGVELPLQGWKIHASACLDNAQEVVAAAWDYCISAGIAFKFIAGRDVFLTRNLKYAGRGSSGKLVTIYPTDEAQLEVVLTELGRRLEGQKGPYILSDLRWGSGPLYVRYGGFAERYCIGPSGVQEPAIEDADGRLVPDVRGPAFKVPAWIALPKLLEPHLTARNSVTVEELPCTVEYPLHFSNSGGVYVGAHRGTGERVVLKEARPYAGLSMDGSDAVTRLARERDNLERLAGIGAVPALLDYRTVGEHHFLMQEFVEGESLHSCLAERSPLLERDLDPAAAAEYAVWAMDVCQRIEAAVASVHAQGLAIMDVHPSNVLVRPDGSVALIDLEMAAPASDDPRQTLADPGFLAPAGVTGLDVDRYALACMRMYVFMSLTALFALDEGKPARLAAEIADLFPTAREFLAEAARTIGALSASAKRPADPAPFLAPLDPDQPGCWEASRDSIAAAILASATPDRDDRLFPGDAEQFVSGGLNVAHGAAGVLYALDVTGAGRYPEYEEWLVRQLADPPSGTRLGFYDGLHGVAYVLHHLGRTDDALELLGRCLEETAGKYEHFGLDLKGGLAGIGLNLLHFAAATGEETFWTCAREVVEIVAARVGEAESVPAISGGEHPYAGLVRGSSGPALLLMRMYDHSGDEALLDLAATALRQDLRRCITRPEDGALHVNEGWRSLPYLADGSVGIAFALQDYLARREDEQFAEALAATRTAAESYLYIEPGLFYGRAGMILFLSREHSPGSAAECDHVVADQVRRLAWHALSYQGHLAFPGEQLMRLSMDLATGSAGVLLALGAALHVGAVQLPFLQAPTAQPAERELVMTTNAERR
jgi:tRNA A-37 threonylcarbamoyl transferase component Bud32